VVRFFGARKADFPNVPLLDGAVMILAISSGENAAFADLSGLLTSVLQDSEAKHTPMFKCIKPFLPVFDLAPAPPKRFGCDQPTSASFGMGVDGRP
jgi:hypothetical protein